MTFEAFLSAPSRASVALLGLGRANGAVLSWLHRHGGKGMGAKNNVGRLLFNFQANVANERTVDRAGEGFGVRVFLAMLCHGVKFSVKEAAGVDGQGVEHIGGNAEPTANAENRIVYHALHTHGAQMLSHGLGGNVMSLTRGDGKNQNFHSKASLSPWVVAQKCKFAAQSIFSLQKNLQKGSV